MTAIAARVCAHERRPPSSDEVEPLLAAMSDRGGEHRDSLVSGTAALAAAWFGWEAALDAKVGASRIAGHRGVLVAADATLYYKGELIATLARAGGPIDTDSSAADLILAAYEAHGDGLLGYLEGDYAFVLWDERRRLLLAARDFGGKRPLYYAEHDGSLTLASTIGGVIASPDVPRALALGAIVTVASGMWCHSAETCYRAVRELPAGHFVRWEAGSPAVVRRFWSPPQTLQRSGDPRDGASELLELLSRATAERLAPGGVTGVTLSGGRDSTAVYGAAQRVLRDQDQPTRALRAVSISYPPDDPGYEDELINATTAFWNDAPDWIPIAGVPMFSDTGSLRHRHEPWSHPFENWNRALSRTARDGGARVVLDGFGGDQLFQVSDVYLADLLRSGRWWTVARQWRARGGGGARAFYRGAVRPRLSDGALRLIARLRGMGPPVHYLDRTPPVWMRGDFLAKHQVLERERAARPVLPRSSAMLAETHAFLVFPNFPRMSGRLASFALSEGVELRSPLLDARVVAFAAPRPWTDRVNGRDTKILLRRSMAGLLPETVLAPRSHKTGVTTGYFTRSMMEAGPSMIDDLARGSALADCGALNVSTLRRAWEFFVNSPDTELGARIYFTLQADFWLREQASA